MVAGLRAHVEIALDLFANRAKIVTPPDQLNVDAARDTTIATAARVVFEHPDLRRFIEGNPQFATESVAGLQDALKSPLDGLTHDFQDSDLRVAEYEFDVSLDPDELPEGDKSAYSTIRIRAVMRNHKWVTSPGTPDQLVEES